VLAAKLPDHRRHFNARGVLAIGYRLELMSTAHANIDAGRVTLKIQPDGGVVPLSMKSSFACWPRPPR
jgi:hypothetical protein